MKYPLIFTFRDFVVGEGFVGGVTIRGQVIASLEEDEEGKKWWLYGVQPGGIDDYGETLKESHLSFRNTLKETLIEIARDSSGFGQFEMSVREFFDDVNRDNADAWTDLANQIRRGDILPEGQAAELRRVDMNEANSIEIVRLDQTTQRLSPQDNLVEALAQAA